MHQIKLSFPGLSSLCVSLTTTEGAGGGTPGAAAASCFSGCDRFFSPVTVIASAAGNSAAYAVFHRWSATYEIPLQPDGRQRSEFRRFGFPEGFQVRTTQRITS